MKIGWTRAARRGIVLLEPAQAEADLLQVDRADVGAEGVAEIDQPVLSGEIAVADPAPVLVGQAERAAHRGAFERRRTRVAAAAGEEQRDQQAERGGETQGCAFVHDRGSLALLRASDQAE